MISNLQDEQPVVLVISESTSKLKDLVVDFLVKSPLEVKSLDLNEEFFLKYQDFVKLYKSIYKIVFIYGFDFYSENVYGRVFSFIEELNKQNAEDIPLVLISSISTSLEILDDSGSGYCLFLKKQQRFLFNFYKKFPQGQIFLAQDLLLNSGRITYPLLLFFSAIKRNYLIDPQKKFYFQDEKSFFNLIKQYLIKPHKNSKFLLRGKAIDSKKILQKINYLFEQYFQKKMLVVELISSHGQEKFFQEFSLVSNVKTEIDDLIDLKIRSLTDNKKEIVKESLSDQEFNKALEKSRLYRKQFKRKNKAQKDIEKNRIEIGLSLIEKARKEDAEEQPESSFSGELDGEIEELFSIQREEEKQNRQEKNLNKGQKILKKKKKRKLLFYLGALSFIFSFLFLVLFSLFNFSQAVLKKQILAVLSNSGDKTIENIDKSIVFRFFDFQLWQYEKIFSEEGMSEALDLRDLEKLVVYLHEKELQVNQKSYDLYLKTVNGGEDLNLFYEEVISLIKQKQQAQKDFNSFLSDLNLDLYQDEEREVWQNTIESNKENLAKTVQIESFLTTFKDLITRDTKTKILLLNQDSAELRSNGGFLTDLSVLTFENGTLLDKRVVSVSELDELVYGYKESPKEIKEYLGEETLFLRDSNWWADFTESAKEISWFVEQVDGGKVDLLVAMNSKVNKEIINVFNTFDLNGSEITVNNFLEKQEQAALYDYKEQKSQGFSWQISNLFLDKFTKLNEKEFYDLVNVLIEQLSRRELMLYSANQQLQAAIENNSWSGEKINVLCPGEFRRDNCLTDSLYQLESNVGINKINPYIKETIEHNIGISEKYIRHKRVIVFENQAKDSSWPLGIYRNYLKFYLNSQATLEKVELNNMIIDKTKLIADDNGDKVVSVFLEIPEQSSLKLSITYLVPNQVESPFSYVFLDQKQAGVFDKKTTYNIVFDEKFKPQLIAPRADYQDKIISFENDNSDHFLFAIDFSE